MKIKKTFVVIGGRLYSARFEGESLHAFKKIFEEWNNAEFLESFFEEHKSDLRCYWPEMSVETG